MDVKAKIRMQYRDALRAGAKPRGLAAKLAKAEGVSDATVRSWMKRDRDRGLDWDDLSIPDETFQETVATDTENVATKSRNVATETDDSSRYNWEALKREYITGKYSSLSDFARQKGFAENNGSFWNRVKGWNEEKQEYDRKVAEETLRKTAEKASDEFSDFAIHTAKTLLEVFEENQAIERNLIAKLYQRTDQIIEELNQKQVVTRRKKRAKLQTQIPASLKLGETEIVTPGDLEYIAEETDEDIEVLVGLVDHDKYEAVTRGLERIQKMNRIAYGIDLAEKREERALERQARSQEHADRSRAAVLGQSPGSPGEGAGAGKAIVVEFNIPRPDWSKTREQPEEGEKDA